jgi:hypothetical protein
LRDYHEEASDGASPGKLLGVVRDERFAEPGTQPPGSILRSGGDNRNWGVFRHAGAPDSRDLEDRIEQLVKAAQAGR